MFTLEEKDLKIVWDNIEKYPAKVTTLRALVHLETGTTFILDSIEKDESPSVQIFKTEEINFLLTKARLSGSPG